MDENKFTNETVETTEVETVETTETVTENVIMATAETVVDGSYKFSNISQEPTRYDKSMHKIGKMWMGGILALLLAVPFIIGAIFSTSIDFGVLGKGEVWMFILSQFIGAVAEVFIYCGMLGKGGSYLGFVTGNLSNLKVPCALNAQEIAGTKQGTKEGEIISTIAIATSSIVTTVVIIIGVIAFVPLRPVFEDPIFKPAFNSVVYALFGAMLVKYIIEYPKLFILPFTVATIIGLTWQSVGGNVATMMIVCGAVSIGFGLVLLKFKKI